MAQWMIMRYATPRRVALELVWAAAAFMAPGAGAAGAQEAAGAAAKSQWVSYNDAGKLVYKTTAKGDRIMDFSFAGYRGGGVALPEVAVKKTVAPTGGDDTAAIQAALDEVARLPLAGGFRGAVLLGPGTFDCPKPLKISAGGVVLRGSGAGTGGTTIKMTGEPHIGLTIQGAGGATASGNPTAITDAYVPAGATEFNVADTAGFKAGDAIIINHPVTEGWVKFMGMDDMVRAGKKQTWISTRTVIRSERIIKKIDGKRLTLEVPLADDLDAKFLEPAGGSVVKVARDGAIAEVGVEKLRIVAPPQAVQITQAHHQAIRISNTADAWLKDLAIEDTVNSISITGGKRITVEGVNIKHTVATVGAAKPADLNPNGTQILIDRCTVQGDNIFYLATGSGVTGPNVLLNCKFEGNGHVQPHMRWAAGLLVDGCQAPGGGIDLMNRGIMGSGHGWTIGWSVAWNCAAKSFVIQMPPGSANWAIGCRGARVLQARPSDPAIKDPKLPEGIFEAHGTPVAPASLYLAQLKERLGAGAVKAMGY